MYINIHGSNKISYIKYSSINILHKFFLHYRTRSGNHQLLLVQLELKPPFLMACLTPNRQQDSMPTLPRRMQPQSKIKTVGFIFDINQSMFFLDIIQNRKTINYQIWAMSDFPFVQTFSIRVLIRRPINETWLWIIPIDQIGIVHRVLYTPCRS